MRRLLFAFVALSLASCVSHHRRYATGDLPPPRQAPMEPQPVYVAQPPPQPVYVQPAQPVYVPAPQPAYVQPTYSTPTPPPGYVQPTYGAPTTAPAILPGTHHAEPIPASAGTIDPGSASRIAQNYGSSRGFPCTARSVTRRGDLYEVDLQGQSGGFMRVGVQAYNGQPSLLEDGRSTGPHTHSATPIR